MADEGPDYVDPGWVVVTLFATIRALQFVTVRIARLSADKQIASELRGLDERLADLLDDVERQALRLGIHMRDPPQGP